MFIESAEQGDLKSVSRIHGECFRNGWSDGEFDAFLQQTCYWLLIARIPRQTKRKISGFVLVKQVEDEAEIISIAVSPDSQKRGTGQKLLDETIRRLEKDRVRILSLDVEENNAAALSMYRKLGFREVNRRESYYTPISSKDALSAALVMQLDLG